MGPVEPVRDPEALQDQGQGEEEQGRDRRESTEGPRPPARPEGIHEAEAEPGGDPGEDRHHQDQDHAEH